jgi:hypothetical protein
VAAFIEPTLMETPPDPWSGRWRDLWQLAKLGWRFSKLGRDGPAAIEILTGAARPILDRWFESEQLKVTLATDAYGPIADNAGGNAQMTHQPHEVRARTDALDSLGNTTAATGKGFAIGSAALTALALFAAYKVAAGKDCNLSLDNAQVVMGLLVGAMLPFVFSSMAMKAVGKAANAMVEEVRRQFRDIAGLMEGTAQGDTARCVSIATAAAIREMILPGLLAVVSPVLVGLVLGAEALGGLLAGATVTGVLLAISMANSGGAWDNAKKFIEAGNYGGKGSDPYKASVVGDTVGEQADVFYYGGGANLYVFPGSPVTPFFALGGGGARGRKKADQFTIEVGHYTTANAGAGVLIALKKRVTLRFDFRDHVVFGPDYTRELLEYSGGLAVVF